MNKLYINDTNISTTLSIFSPKLREIVRQYFPFKSKKTLSLIYDGNTLVRHYCDEYEIHFCLTSDQLSNDENFLHEFFHCVQKEEGFPSLHCNVSSFKNLETELTSFVLDFDVGDRLVTNGYRRSNKYEASIILYKKAIHYIELLNNKTVFVSIEDEIGQSGMLAHLKYFNFKIDDLLITTKNVRPKIYKTYQIMYEAINSYPYDTIDGVYKIYQILLHKLNLQEYFSIE